MVLSFASGFLGPTGKLRLAIQFATILIAALAILERIVASWYGIPSPAGDQLYFMPVAYIAANGGGLMHPFWSPTGLGGGPFDWHGWLYPTVLSWIPFSSSAAGVVFSATLLGVLCLIPLLLLTSRLKAPLVRASYIITCVGVGLYQIGRPESLTTLWLGLLVLAWLRFDKNTRAALSGLLLALTVVTQPTIGAIAVLLCVGANFLFLRKAFWQAIVANTLLAAWFIGCFAALWIVAPLGFVEWITGVTSHIQIMAQRSDGGLREFLQYYVLTQSLPFFAGYVVAALAIAFSFARAGRLNSPSAWALGAACAIWLLLVWYTAIRIPPTFYNFVAFAPVVFLIAAWKRAGLWAVGATSIAIGVGVVHASIVVLYSLGGVPIASLEQYARSQPTCQLAVASEAWMPIHEVLGKSPCVGKCDATLSLMSNTGAAHAPASMAGKILIGEDVAASMPTIFGIPLTRTLKDYAFAVYGDSQRCGPPPQRE